MKTIYARLGDLQLGETLEDGTSLGTIGKALDEVGINIQTSTGDLRDMGDVIEELMGKWQDLDTAQKQALAVKLAGKYQYNNLMALLENSEMYEENLEAAQNSLGTINQQQQIYLDSLEGKLNTLQSTFEGFINSIFNVDDIKPFIDDITGLIQLLTGFVTSVGSKSIFSGILGVGTKVFSSNIGDQVMKASENRKARKRRQESIEEGNKLLSEIDVDSSQLGKDSKTFQAAKSLGARTSSMNESQRGQSRQVLSQMAKLENDILDKREKSATILNKMEVVYKNVTGQSLELKMNEEGQVENLDQALLVLNSIKGAFKDIDKSSEKASDSAGKMLASLNSHGEGAARNKNNGFNAKTRDNMFSASTEFDEFVKGLSTNKKLMNSNGENILSSLPQYQAMMEANTAFGEAVSKMPTKGKKVSQTVSDEVEGAFNKSRQAVVEFIGALQRLDGVDEETAKSIQELLEKLGVAKNTLAGLSKGVESFSDSLDMKQLATDTAELLGSLATMYSTLQSIKSLGGIWADKDMEFGEKVSSTVENLLFSLPMLITSVSSLGTSFSNVRTSLTNWNNGLLQSSGIAIATATATDRLKVAIKGVGTLLKSNWAGLLLSIIPMAISAVSGVVEQQEENAKQEAQETIDKYDELKNKAEQTQQAQQKVKENYDIYKETGKVTDELKDSIQAYADTLDVPLSKQDLWNENIKETIDNLNRAAQLQKEGLRDSSRDAARTSEANFRTSQIQKNNKLTERSSSVAPAEDYFNQNQELFNKVSPYLETLGFDTSDWSSVQEGMNTLYQVVTGAANFTDLATGIDATEEDIENIFKEVAQDTSGLFSQISAYNDMYGSAYLDEGSLKVNSPAMLKKVIEEQVIGRQGSLSTLDFGLNDEGKLEVTVKPDADLALAASQLSQFSDLKLDRVLATAGVSDAEKDDEASARWRYGEALQSAQTLYQDADLQKYLSSSLSAAENELAGILFQKQNNGETITFDTIADLFQNNDTISKMTQQGFNPKDLGNIAVDLADLFNITIDEDTKKQINGLEESLSETSNNAAVVAANQERAIGKQRAAQYVGENQFGLKGADYIDKRLLPTVTNLLGISEDDFYSRIESNRGRLTPDANYENIFDYIKNQKASGADMDLVMQLLASEDGLINAINGNTDALDSQYDVLVYQKNLKEGAEERYRTSQAWTGKSDKAINEELEAADKTINEKLNSVNYNFTDDQKTALIADVYTHLDEVIAGTYDWDEAIKRVVTNLDDLSDATKTTQEAFDKASPKIMAAAEAQLKKEKGDNYTDEDVKKKAEGYGQTFISGLGDEGAQAVFSGISSGLFDAQGIENWVTSALEAGASKKMIVEWLKEAVQNGVHVDVNAKYDGELDSQIFEEGMIEREAQKKADMWNPALQSKTQRIMHESGVSESVARVQASKEIDDLDASLKELDLTADDVVAMGIDLKQSNEAIIEQVKAVQSGDAKGIEAAGNFNGLNTGPIGKFADTDKNGFNDAQQELWEYAKGLGYTKEEFAALVDQANKAGLSTEDFRQRLENLTYGLDSISKNAQEAAEALARAGVSTEQRPVYDEFGNATGSYTSDVQETVSNWDPWMTDQLSSMGMFDKENTAVFKDFLGVAPEFQFAAIPYLDSSKLKEQVAELNLDPPDFFLHAQIVDVQDAVESVQSSISSGADIDSDALEKLYKIAPELREISLASKDGEVALKNLNAQLQQMEIGVLSDEKAKLVSQKQEIEQQLSDYSRGKIGIQIDKDQAIKDLNSINKQLDKIKTEIDIKINVHAEDMFDNLQDMEKEIETIKNAFSDGSGIIDTDTYHEALKYYEDLGDYMQIVGNDQIRISKEGQDAFIAAAEAKQQAAVNEVKTELKLLGDYHGAQAAAYEAAAAQYVAMANAQLTTDEEVGDTRASIDQDLTNSLSTNDQILADMSADSSTSEMKNSSDVANQANTDNATMVSNTQSALTAQAQMYSQWANSAIANANQVATAIANAAKGKTSPGGASAQMVGASYGGKASTAGTTSNTSTKKDSTSGSDWNVSNYKKNALLMADQLNKQAEAEREMQNKFYNDMAGLDALIQPGSNKINKKSGSGSGSGNGSGSSYDPKTKDKLEDEADRYEKVNAQIDKLNNALEQLNTEEARLIGFNRVNIIQKETENIKRQIEVYKQKLELQKQERDEVKKKLEDDFKVEFDDEGYISNYQKKFEEYLAGINHLIDLYNAETTEEGQKKLEEQIEAAKDNFEDFKDLISKYDELNSNTIKETEKSIQDLHDKIEDMMIDLFNKAVEAADSIKDIEDKWLDLKKAMDLRDQEDPFLAMEISAEKLKGYFDNASEASDNFFNKAIDHYAELKKNAKTDEEKKFYQDRINDMEAGKKAQGKQTVERNGSGYLDMVFNNAAMINEQIKQYEETGKSSMFGENQQALYEAAQTIYDQAADAITNLREDIDNLQDEILDGIDKIADTMDERAEVLERMTDQLDHYVSLTQTLYGESIQGYEQQEKILQAKVDLVNRELVEAHTNAEHWKQISQQFDEGTEERKKADEKAAEAVTKENELLATSIETAQQLLAVQGNKAVSKWVNDLFGQDLDWTQTQWEMINRNADYYLDSVNKAYNIQKLQGQYVDLLDNASALSTQTKITDQMNQQLTYLREKDKLSEYDVSYAQAQLEILKQQIALEEAQVNKSQMKLRRDSQGNYNYVYTANEDDVKSAQEGLLDAQNNAYNLSKDQMQQTQSDALSAIQSTKQTLINIFTDTALSIQERKDRMKEVIDSLQEYLLSTGEQLSTSQANILNDFYGMVDSLSSENSEAMLDTFDKLQSGMGDSFDKANTWWKNAISNALGATDKIQQANETLFKELQAPLDTYNANINNASTSAGNAIDQITTKVDDITNATGKLADSFNAVNTSIENMLNLLQGSEQTLKDFKAKYAELVNQNSEYIRELEKLRAELNEKNKETAQGGKGTTTSTSSNGSGNGKGDSDGKNSNNNFGGSGYSREELMKGIAFAIFNHEWDSGWGDDPQRRDKLIKAYGEDFADDVQNYINAHWYDDSVFYPDFERSKKFWSTTLVGYDTGGYTGEWSGRSGKLAVLHSKEIVLNASDTQNILKAVESVRAMTSAMKGATLAEAVGSISSIGKSIETASSKVDQNVNITAEFPNATSADEIREAILGLNNQVLHYTHRKA